MEKYPEVEAMHGITGIWDGTHIWTFFDRNFGPFSRADWTSHKIKPRKSALATQVHIFQANLFNWNRLL